MEQATYIVKVCDLFKNEPGISDIAKHFLNLWSGFFKCKFYYLEVIDRNKRLRTQQRKNWIDYANGKIVSNNPQLNPYNPVAVQIAFNHLVEKIAELNQRYVDIMADLRMLCGAFWRDYNNLRQHFSPNVLNHFQVASLYYTRSL